MSKKSFLVTNIQKGGFNNINYKIKLDMNQLIDVIEMYYLNNTKNTFTSKINGEELIFFIIPGSNNRFPNTTPEKYFQRLKDRPSIVRLKSFCSTVFNIYLKNYENEPIQYEVINSEQAGGSLKKIYTGSKGGKYYIINGNKRYI